jgi:hypothetical protein
MALALALLTIVSHLNVFEFCLLLLLMKYYSFFTIENRIYFINNRKLGIAYSHDIAFVISLLNKYFCLSEWMRL